MFKSKYRYELVKCGVTPTWGKDSQETFHNPITKGDKVKGAMSGSELVEVVAVEHYSTCSVAYYK